MSAPTSIMSLGEMETGIEIAGWRGLRNKSESLQNRAAYVVPEYQEPAYGDSKNPPIEVALSSFVGDFKLKPGTYFDPLESILVNHDDKFR
ncbi:hypothetical protein K458DRAFT_437740 [Lentithecium fluviatile CBS 122367]|uniref:Uncharacterized protein n=1 Tax=Lentithecium fluviatile CBS 122367 TaxID=1168545 RepID=A0A6G1IC85_9PLEO|nr:hypothetical protein K458DRAFT_437740 [Lentithecium fluviatile CBS 122367]